MGWGSFGASKEMSWPIGEGPGNGDTVISGPGTIYYTSWLEAPLDRPAPTVRSSERGWTREIWTSGTASSGRPVTRGVEQSPRTGKMLDSKSGGPNRGIAGLEPVAEDHKRRLRRHRHAGDRAYLRCGRAAIGRAKLF